MLTSTEYTRGPSSSYAPERRDGNPSERRGRAAHPAGVSGRSLDKRTLLPKRPGGSATQWLGSHYKGTGETVWRLSMSIPGGFWRCPCGGLGRAEEPYCLYCGEFRSGGNDVDHARRAAARARTQVRRYCKANRIRRMWTLTYARARWERAAVVRDVLTFAERMRVRFGDVAWIAALELHPDGHGWHVHFGLPARFFDHAEMTALWRHGFVQFSDGPWSEKGVGGHELARRLSGYLAKYLVKDCQEDGSGHRWERKRGEHRYLVAQGHAVVCRQRRVDTLSQVYRVSRLWHQGASLGGQYGPNSVAVREFSSAEWDGWRGPPVLVLWEV